MEGLGRKWRDHMCVTLTLGDAVMDGLCENVAKTVTVSKRPS